MIEQDKGKWKSAKQPDIKYKRLAELFDAYQEARIRNVLHILAMEMEVPVTTIKERIRKCRQLGLIPSPGKGNG